ncbi:MAG: ubiquinol-cytochrome C chaperone family protein [Bauldia sp.]
MAQARNPVLYADFGVADTVDGRFEMVVLHAVLVIDCLQKGGEAEKAAAQKVFDLFCTDMDRSLRELGVGDLGIPKRMKQMTERFYGRAQAYRTAFEGADHGGMIDVLSRNVFGGPAEGAEPLAAYALASSEALAAAPDNLLHGGTLRFADPASYVPGRAPA